MSRTLTFALLLAASACGGGRQPAPATSTTASEHAGSGSGPGPGAGPGAEMAEPQGVSAEMTAFHDLLAPRWHAAVGPQRIQDTCGAVEQFKAAADAVAKATPPLAANADTWTAGTRALVAAVEGLAKSCASNAGFDASFEKVHNAFHALMEQAQPHGGAEAHDHPQ